MGLFVRVWFASQVVLVACATGTFYLAWFLSALPDGARILGITVGASSLLTNMGAVLFAGAMDRGHKVRFLVTTAAAGLLAFGLVILQPSAPVHGQYLTSATVVIATTIGIVAYVLCQMSQDLYFACVETWLSLVASEHWASSRVAASIQGQRPIARFLAPLVAGPFLEGGHTIATICIAAIALSQGLFLIGPGEAKSNHSAHPRRPGATALSVLVEDARAALGIIRKNPSLLFLLVISALGNLVVFPIFSMLPALVRDLTSVDMERIYTRASTMYGGGMILGTLLMTILPWPAVRKDWSSALLLGSVFLILATAIQIPVRHVGFPAAFGLAGVGFMILTAVAGGAWFEQTPADIRARVFSLRRLIGFATIPIGTITIGLFGTVLGTAGAMEALIGISGASLLFAAVHHAYAQR